MIPDHFKVSDKLKKLNLLFLTLTIVAPPRLSIPLRADHVSCLPSGPCDVRGVMRSAPHRHGSSPKGPLHAARTPHYREVTSTLRPGSPRASTHSSSLSLNLPRTPRTARRAAASPPPRFRSAPPPPASPPTANPKRLRTPPPGAAVFRSCLTPHRAPGKPPHHPQPAFEEGASGDRVSRRPRTLAPLDSGLPGPRIGKPCEQSGRFGSRCRLRERRVKWSLFDARPLLHLTRRPLGGEVSAQRRGTSRVAA